MRKEKNSVLDIKTRDVINKKNLVEMFNNHIVENSTGVASIELVTPLDLNFDRDTFEKVLKHEPRSSITKIKN